MTDQIQSFIQGLGNFMSQMQTQEAEMKCPKQEITETDPLKHAIIEMMIENSGCHICDSGGVSGRAWQHNRQITDWEALPELKVETWSDNDFYCSVSAYKFLTSFLSITEESRKWQKKFDEFCDLEEYRSESWITCMEEFSKRKLGIEYVRLENTYNYDNLLDHDIQFLMTYWDNPARKVDLDQPLIILQIHTGMDIRGGYSSPRIFTLEEPDYFIMAMTDLYARCNKCGMNWDSDNCGYDWTFDHCDSNMKPLDGERDEEFRTVVDEDKIVRHKGCGGKIDFTPRLFY